MSRLISRLLVAAVALSGCFAAHALLNVDPLAGISPAQVDDLTRRVALCPELASQVATQLDESFGHLTQGAWKALMRSARECGGQRRTLDERARYRLAYSGLKALLGDQTEPHAPSAPAPALKLSWQLGAAAR